MKRILRHIGFHFADPLVRVAILAVACAVLWRGPARAADTPEMQSPPPAATATATPDATPTEPVWATGVEYVEARAHIVQIADGMVYVDAGGDQGIVPGTDMTYFETVEIRDLNGNPLGTDSIPAGTLSVQHVEQRMSSATITEQKKDPERGMLVKYLTPAATAVREQKTNCPEGMQFVAGGSFAYTPGALTRDSFVDVQNLTEISDAFCMDISADKKMLSWRDARDFCGALGRRLCSREEQHKACVENTRKPVCSPEQAKAGTCPRGSALEDFVSTLEWTGSWSENDPATDAPTSRTGSCSCTGQRPACTTCYYPECNGIVKKFRCCSDPE